MSLALFATLRVAAPSGLDAARDRIVGILAVAPGERPLAPRFGWRAHDLGPLSLLGAEGAVARAAAAVWAEEALHELAPDLGVERVEILSAKDGVAVVGVALAGGRVEAEIAFGRERATWPGN